MDNFSVEIESKVKEICENISLGIRSRGNRAANELRNASQLVLRGQRSGRTYNVPGTGRMKYYKRGSKDGKHKAGTATITYKRYTASAPGEPPAVRTGAFRASWQPETRVDLGTNNQVSVRAFIRSKIRTNNKKYLLGEILEEGTGKMAPRPYQEKIQEKALPKIVKIYKEPYDL